MHQVGDRPRHAGLAAALQEHIEPVARLGLGAADLAQPQRRVRAHDALPGDVMRLPRVVAVAIALVVEAPAAGRRAA